MSGAARAAGRWRQVTGAIPLRPWRAASLARLAGLLDATLQCWAADWGVPAQEIPRVRCAAASACEERDGWSECGRNAAGAAWLRCSPREHALPAAAWLGDDAQTTPVVAAVTALARQDALERLVGALGLEPASGDLGPPPDCWWSWSGAVIADLPGGDRLLLSAPAFASATGTPDPVRKRGPLVRCRDAIAGQPMRLHVELEGCEVALAELASLQLGDVLRLCHATAAPACVRGAAGEVLFDGWLARSRGRRAVELVARAAADRSPEGTAR